MRAIFWTQAACEEYKDAIAYLASENPSAAASIASKVEALVEGLSEAPAGRPGRAPGTYEKGIAGLFYVTYALNTPAEGVENIVILRVVHGSRG
jgi:toxin ParE1/3/4